MNTRRIGSRYEELAADYLRSRGYEILAQNYHHHRYGEKDIIARDGDTVVAVEVKYRRTADYGDPFEAVGIKKQRTISRALLAYLMQTHRGTDTPCRFDVMGIVGEDEPDIRYIENAFYFVG